MKTGDQVILTGKTHKGKNRIREHGKEWEIEQIVSRVGFDDRGGPWGLVAPINSQHPGAKHASRWVHLERDKDFQVERA